MQPASCSLVCSPAGRAALQQCISSAAASHCQLQQLTLHSPALQIELHCVEDAIQELQMAHSRDSAEAAAQLQEAQEAAMQRLYAASQRSSSVLQRAVSMQQQRPQVQLQLQVGAQTAQLSLWVHTRAAARFWSAWRPSTSSSSPPVQAGALV